MAKNALERPSERWERILRLQNIERLEASCGEAWFSLAPGVSERFKHCITVCVCVFVLLWFLCAVRVSGADPERIGGGTSIKYIKCNSGKTTIKYEKLSHLKCNKSKKNNITYKAFNLNKFYLEYYK